MELHQSQWHSTEIISLITHPGKLASSNLTTAVSKLPIQSTNKKKKSHVPQKEKKIQTPIRRKTGMLEEVNTKEYQLGTLFKKNSSFYVQNSEIDLGFLVLTIYISQFLTVLYITFR